MASVRILAFLACSAALYFASSILIPIALGYFLFVLLDPAVIWLKGSGISRTWSSITLVIVSILISVAMVWGFYGAFADIAREVPAYSQKLRSMAATATKKAANLEKSATEAVPQPQPKDDVQKVEVVQGYTGWTGYALKGLGTLVDALTAAFFIPLIAVFLLLDRNSMARALKNVAPPDFELKKAGNEIQQMLRSFFIGNLIIGVGMSICLSVLYVCLGMHNAVPLGIATGFLNLIPLAGPIFSLTFPILQGLLQFDSVGPFLIITITVIVLHLVVSNVIVPKVVGSHINVNVVAATVGLMFWGWVWGAVGLLLAVPLVALLKIVLVNQPTWKNYGLLLSEEETPDGQPQSVRTLLKKATSQLSD
jgi:predicted PurR-regulated permease PerM